jgi:hypothetical protein
MLLASYISGLRGNPALLSSLQEAIKIAVTVEQAKSHEHKIEAFYLDGEAKVSRYSNEAAHRTYK